MLASDVLLAYSRSQLKHIKQHNKKQYGAKNKHDTKLHTEAHHTHTSTRDDRCPPDTWKQPVVTELQLKRFSWVSYRGFYRVHVTEEEPNHVKLYTRGFFKRISSVSDSDDAASAFYPEFLRFVYIRTLEVPRHVTYRPGPHLHPHTRFLMCLKFD